MKHAFLRRLGALALALSMAASLCVTPAWAAADSIADLSLSSTLMVLTPNSPQTLSIVGTLPDGATVEWKPDPNNAITVTPDPGAPDRATFATLSSEASDIRGAKVTATVKYGAATDDITERNLDCIVYSGASPVETVPDITLAANTTRVVRVTIQENAKRVGEISFISNDRNTARVDSVSARVYDGTTDSAYYDVTVRGVAEGNTTIRMTTAQGGYPLGSWDVEVTRAIPGTVVESVRITPPTYVMPSGVASYKLTTIVLPEKATNRTLKWTSSNENVATVDQNGVVTRVGPGKTTITAASTDGSNKFGTCLVTVEEAPSALDLTPASATLNLDQGPTSVQLSAAPSGQGSADATIAWTSSNTSVAPVDRNGKVTALKVGSATITATATFRVNNTTRTISKTCTITVVDNNSTLADKVTLDKEKHSMPADGTVTLRATVSPANAPVKTITWDSSNKGVATVDQNGKVTAVGPGQTMITATAYGDRGEAVCIVTVTPKAESIRLSFAYDSNTPGTNRYSYTFKTTGNDYIKVKAILTPAPPNPNPAADPIRWTSKDTSVATVSAGTGDQVSITPVSPGRTTITAAPMDPAGKDRAEVIPAEITVIVSGISIAKSEDGGTPQPITSLTLAEGRRQTVTALTYGSAGGGSCDWSSSDPSIVRVGTKTGASTTLTGARPGTAVITARSGTFSGTCTVTVGEDSAVAITASTPPGSPLQFSKLVSQLQSACTSKTGSPLSYITNLAVASTDQGILHDQHHSSADTGAGVGVQDRYYPGTAPQGQRSMNDLSFVPRNTFSGTAEITYTGWSTNSKSFNGTIRVTVNGTGDVMYSSSEGAPVNFVADDFNLYHPNFRSVSFTPPQDSVGTLYYNYTSPSQPGTKVSSGTTYSRTGNPGLDRVTFVPAAGYVGTVRISYKGTDTAGRSFTGVVTITVNGGGDNGGSTADISYPMKEDSWVTFRPADFNAASQNTLGEPLSYVRFALPPSSEGTLFYNYRGFGDYDSAVASTTSYYYSGTPSLGGVSFVPTTTTPSQVDIDYTGYTIKGNTFTGTIHLGQDGSSQQGGMRYTVFTGRSVNFSANSFNTACIAATGASLDYVLFTQMPTVAQGSLRYTRGNSSTNNSLSTTTRCYRSAPNSWDVQLSNVYFQANANYTGTVVLPFTGYNTNGSSFTGQVTIEVTPPTAGNITYTGTTASPYRLSVYDVQSACSGALDGTLSYITFTSLPSASAGRLYSGYNGFRTGSQVNTGTRYYASGSPSISQLSFVPRGRYNGQVAIGFTATNTSGQSVNGRIVLNLSSNGSSAYFSDLIYHTWAAPAVDYLYQNGVTKGVTATAFGPNQQINRCDFVLMLCRAFKFSEVSGYSFADVPTDSYFAGAVAAAKQRGIVSGDGANFRPYGKLTRQDAMVMIKNALDAAGWSINASSTSILNQFSDGAAVSPYARNAVSALVQLGAVNGDNGRLLPHNPITRAEAAVILHFVMTM